jgi:hypothetical protein
LKTGLVACAAAAAALGLVTTGCAGSSPTTVKELAAYTDAYGATTSAKTARVWVYVNIHAPRATTYVLAQGNANLATGACALSVEDEGATTNELVNANDLYFEVPAEARATSHGRPWAEVVLRSGGRSGPDVAMGSPLAEVDPVPMLDALAAGPESSTYLGEGRIGGHAASEYRLDVPTTALVGQVTGGGGAMRFGLISLIADLPHPGVKFLPIYVWLDKEGRAIQIVTSATLGTEPAAPGPFQAALANQLPTTVSVRVNLGYFGERARLVPPPSSEVALVPLSQLQAGAL